MPTKSQFEDAASRLGISRDSHVVVYDTTGVFSSPRAAFTFKVSYMIDLSPFFFFFFFFPVAQRHFRTFQALQPRQGFDPRWRLAPVGGREPPDRHANPFAREPAQRRRPRQDVPTHLERTHLCDETADRVVLYRRREHSLPRAASRIPLSSFFFSHPDRSVSHMAR